MNAGPNSTMDAATLAKAIYVHASHKGGMDGIDVEKISSIILEAAGSSTYTTHQLKLNSEVDRSIARLRAKRQKVDEVQRRHARALVEQRAEELEHTRRLERVCVVIDFDMFYAAVAIRDGGAHLAEKPLAVGGALVLTANYVARRWGVRSAMPAFVAKELCRRGPEFGMPATELNFVPANYAACAPLTAAPPTAPGARGSRP